MSKTGAEDAGLSRAVFLDKDGTVVVDVPYNVDPGLMRLMPGAGEGLRRLSESGYKLIIVSNQSGVARGVFPESALPAVEQRLREMLAEYQAPLSGFYYCPHHPEGAVAEYAVACGCRKPEPGLILRAAAECDVALAESWFVGDILNDVEAGRRAGCRTILLDNGNETEWELNRQRLPDGVVADLDEAADYILCSRPAANGHARLTRTQRGREGGIEDERQDLGFDATLQGFAGAGHRRSDA